MNILVVLRKSECRLNALIVGGRIALATHSDITVLFVLPKVPERFDEYFEADTDKRGQSIKDRVETSHQIDQRLLEEARVSLRANGRGEQRVSSSQLLRDRVLPERRYRAARGSGCA